MANENIDRIFQGQKAKFRIFRDSLSLFFLFFRDKYGSSGTVGMSGTFTTLSAFYSIFITTPIVFSVLSEFIAILDSSSSAYQHFNDSFAYRQMAQRRILFLGKKFRVRFKIIRYHTFQRESQVLGELLISKLLHNLPLKRDYLYVLSTQFADYSNS